MAKTEEGQIKEDCKKIFEANGFYYRSLAIGIIPGRSNPSKGMLDCIVIKRGRTYSPVVWIEYKTPKGKLSKEQEHFIFEWTGKGGLVFVVRSIEDCLEVIRKVNLLTT
jgi:hypothetical protein